ncbi:ABC-2 type transport system permease protein [Paraoerskovia marina]|uniref:ABC-2 type transport system permease protein n=1 Tax=Paraoerskovia marina TaxID=545619 RepID=A0A1H1RDD7_9CELL|nr:hypothetical protein [Paraoerskovia marina]SDS33576.1 ABC-2 type transport system permease protein [Paraoerskovia marina]
MRLLRAESMRFWARTLIRWAMVAGLVVAGLVVLGSWTTSTPPPDEVQASMQADFDASVKDWEDNGETYVADCLAAEKADAEELGEPLDYECDEMGPPVWADYAYFATFAGEGLSTVQLSLLLVALLTLGVGVTFVSAEHTSGAIGNWLTFEPRRSRVYWSKVVAAVLGVVPVTVVMVGLIAGGSLWAYDHHGALGRFDLDQDLRPYLEMWARSAALALGLAASGAALGSLLRHTAIVIGVVAGWAILVEAVAANVFDAIKPWTLVTSMNAWIQGGTAVYVTECDATDDSGMLCDWVEHPVSQTQGGLILTAVVVALVLVSWLVFRRRDVA